MNMWRRKLRLGAVAAVGVVSLVAAACSSSGGSSSGSNSASSGVPIKGGTATVALPAGVTNNWIFPFYAITNSSVYNSNQFQWMFYRPLYMFGNNTNTNVTINYPLSPANPPDYTNGGKTVVINMKGWKWSDGETVNAQSLVFFLNMAKAEKNNWYAYSKTLLPDNVASYKATGPNQLTIQLNSGYSSIWYTYNQLAEINPMPLAWDVTSLGAKAGSGGCTTDSAADGWAKCKAVYTFLTAQSKIASTYATSPLWSVVDGPWKLSSFNTNGNVTIVPNKAYSGSPKPRACPPSSSWRYTADSAEYTALKTGELDVGYIPTQDVGQKPANSSANHLTNPLGSSYYLEPFFSYGIEYAQPNFNNPQVGYLVRQLYIRQAMQSAENQPGISTAIWRGYATPVLGAGPDRANERVPSGHPEGLAVRLQPPGRDGAQRQRGRPEGPDPAGHRHQPLDQPRVGADLVRVDRLRLRDDERPVKPGDGGDPQRPAVQRRAAPAPAAYSSSCSGS